MVLNKSHHAAFADAIEKGDADAVVAIIRQFPELVNHADWTPPPIHCAVLWDQSNIAEILLANGADIELLDPDRHTTPLRYAIMYAKSDLVTLLTFRGANSGPIVEDGTTALQLAHEAASGAFEGFDDLPPRASYQEVVEVLRQSGVSV